MRHGIQQIDLSTQGNAERNSAGSCRAIRAPAPTYRDRPSRAA